MTRSKAPSRNLSATHAPRAKTKRTSPSARRQAEDVADLKAARKVRKEKGAIPLDTVLARLAVQRDRA